MRGCAWRPAAAYRPTFTVVRHQPDPLPASKEARVRRSPAPSDVGGCAVPDEAGQEAPDPWIGGGPGAGARPPRWGLQSAAHTWGTAPRSSSPPPYLSRWPMRCSGERRTFQEGGAVDVVAAAGGLSPPLRSRHKPIKRVHDHLSLGQPGRVGNKVPLPPGRLAEVRRRPVRRRRLGARCTSVDALRPSMVGLAAYDVSKGGVWMVTRSPAPELARHWEANGHISFFFPVSDVTILHLAHAHWRQPARLSERPAESVPVGRCGRASGVGRWC